MLWKVQSRKISCLESSFWNTFWSTLGSIISLELKLVVEVEQWFSNIFKIHDFSIAIAEYELQYCWLSCPWNEFKFTINIHIYNHLLFKTNFERNWNDKLLCNHQIETNNMITWWRNDPQTITEGQRQDNRCGYEMPQVLRCHGDASIWLSRD